jgi:hypothetical protein
VSPRRFTTYSWHVNIYRLFWPPNSALYMGIITHLGRRAGRLRRSRGSRRVGERPRWARSSDLACRARTSKFQRSRIAVGPRTARTTSASCAASCPRTRRTKWGAPRRGSALLKPTPPVRALHVSNVRDRLPTKLRRAGHAPARQNKLTVAVPCDSDDGGSALLWACGGLGPRRVGLDRARDARGSSPCERL